MQKYAIFIGIDISKQWFNVAMYQPELKDKYFQKCFDNQPSGFEQLLLWLDQQSKACPVQGRCFVCMEHTGIYGLALAHFLQQNGLTVVMECPLRIKLSCGLRRGKTDAADARTIANYAVKQHLEIKVRPLPDQLLLLVQSLLSLRARLVRYRVGLDTAAGELSNFVAPNISSAVEVHSHPVSQHIREQIRLLDRQIKQSLCSNERLKKLYGLISSVKGVGPLITAYMLVYTNGFTAFRKSRQFACYIGIAPFEHTSGTSVRLPDQVSFLANKRLKALISTAATVAVIHDPQFKAFFKKKKALGKDNGWIYNAVKNKIVHRIFAVVKRGTPYVVMAHQ